MLTKTQIRNAERRWRHFVFEGWFTPVFFSVGMAIFFVGIFSPKTVTRFLLEHCFCAWFGAMFLYFASSYLLTAWAMITRRDLAGAIWMSAFTLAFGALGGTILKYALLY